MSKRGGQWRQVVERRQNDLASESEEEKMKANDQV